MGLAETFIKYVKDEKLYEPGRSWLLAVSGGLDSTVLCELCHRAGLDYVLAHANFQLRGEESARDESFVRDLAVRYAKPIYVRAFDTTKYAETHKLSIQVAARELRYAWFRELLAEEGSEARCIVTAHHQDDNVETILMNFFKGTGISGIRGILPKQGDIVRPLLFASKETLTHFAIEEGLAWVEDSSNSSDKYTRNYFRHRIIPQIEEVIPGAGANVADNARRFHDIESIYRRFIDDLKVGLIDVRGRETFIPALKLKKTDPLTTIVYEIIKDYGFSASQTDAVIALLDSGSGKYVCSSTHRILRDRAWLIVTPLEEEPLGGHVLIKSTDQPIEYANGVLRFGRLSKMPSSPAPDTALLDAGKIEFPLLLRKYRAGDYFYPLGMKKKKKIARFLIDSKLSLAAKERVWVIEMDKKIIWVAGMRIDDRFKATATSKAILEIRTAGG